MKYFDTASDESFFSLRPLEGGVSPILLELVGPGPQPHPRLLLGLAHELDVCGFLLGVCGAGGRDPSVGSVVSKHRVHLVVPDHH